MLKQQKKRGLDVSIVSVYSVYIFFLTTQRHKGTDWRPRRQTVAGAGRTVCHPEHAVNFIFVEDKNVTQTGTEA